MPNEYGHIEGIGEANRLPRGIRRRCHSKPSSRILGLLTNAVGNLSCLAALPRRFAPYKPGSGSRETLRITTGSSAIRCETTSRSRLGRSPLIPFTHYRLPPMLRRGRRCGKTYRLLLGRLTQNFGKTYMAPLGSLRAATAWAASPEAAPGDRRPCPRPVRQRPGHVFWTRCPSPVWTRVGRAGNGRGSSGSHHQHRPGLRHRPPCHRRARQLRAPHRRRCPGRLHPDRTDRR